MRIIIITLLLLTPAFAQQQPPENRALIARIMTELNGNIGCNVELIKLQERLDAAEAELKKLKEPKPDK